MALRDQLLTELTIHKSVSNYHIKLRNRDNILVDCLLSAALQYKDGKPDRIKGVVRKF